MALGCGRGYQALAACAGRAHVEILLWSKYACELLSIVLTAYYLFIIPIELWRNSLRTMIPSGSCNPRMRHFLEISDYMPASLTYSCTDMLNLPSRSRQRPSTGTSETNRH